MRFLTAAELRAVDAQQLDELVATPELVVAFGEGDIRGLAAAALLFADYAVVKRGSSIIIDEPEAAAAAVWRSEPWDPQPDEVTEETEETWRATWLKGRSVLALDVAASLIRARGGDRLERAAFARLFATGEPQTGLGAFLAKKSPRYS